MSAVRRTAPRPPARAGPSGPEGGVPASTLQRCRSTRVSRLSDLERPARRVVRRIETSHPGELVHIDIKKQARIPKGGRRRVRGSSARTSQGPDPASATPTSLRYRRLLHRSPIPRSMLMSRPPQRSPFREEPETSSPPIAAGRTSLTTTAGSSRSSAFGAELIAPAVLHSRTKPASLDEGKIAVQPDLSRRVGLARP